MSGGSLLLVWLYRTTQAASPELLAATLFSIKQQAGVMAALSAAVFAVLAALETGKAALAGIGAAATAVPSMPSTFGRPAGLVTGSPA